MTELGEAVNHLMKDAFPTIVDITFTANMESLLDSVGDGSVDWKEIVRNFYPDLDEAVKKAEQSLEKAGVKCPKCGSEIIICRSKKGRRFYGCENHDCDFVSWQKPWPEKCPQCGGYMVEKGNKVVCQTKNCGYICEKKA